jgi:HK97 family phage major capsid protein
MSVDERARAFDAYVRTGARNDALLTSAQSEGLGSAGGYLVPDEYAAEIVKRIVAFGGFAAAAKTISTAGGNPLTIGVTVDDSSNLGSIVSEAGAFSSGADVTFDTISLGAYTYASNGTGTDPVKVSWELLDDSSQDVPSLLADLLGDRIGRIQATHWITGTGVSEPLGIVTPKSAFGNIAGTSAPTYAELVQTIHALDPGYRASASWLMSDATLSAIRQIVDDAGRPLWLPQATSGLGTLAGGSLLGFPVVVDQAMPDIASSGATKCIGFGDWRRAYTIRRVKEIGVVRINELYAAARQTGFFAWARADGTVVDSNAYVILASKS